MSLRSANLLTRSLAIAAAILLLVVLAQFVGFGAGYRWAPDSALAEGSDDDRAVALQLSRNAFELPPLHVFNEIADRPLFNEDRLPTPLDDALAEAGEEEPEVPVVPLNVVLTGTIVTPQLAVAMVRDARGQSTSLRVGMPLEDDQAGWTLVEVRPHSATFRSAANESAELELQTAGTAGNPVTRTAQPPRQAAARPPARGVRPTPDELAKRIEERRQQMREEAERIREGVEDDDAKPTQPPAASRGQPQPRTR